MKAKKIFSLALAVVMLFTASVMMFTVNAKLTHYYSCALNSDNSLHTMASIQANPNSERTVFVEMYATHRVDAYGEYGAAVGDRVELKIQVQAERYAGVSYTYATQDEFIVGSTDAYINCSDTFDADELVVKLTGTYEVYNWSSDEFWYTPEIVLEPGDGMIVDCPHVGEF